MSTLTQIQQQVQTYDATAAIARIRREFEEETNESLLFTYVSCGLILFDLAKGLGLSPDEQRDALGGRLYGEVESFLT